MSQNPPSFGVEFTARQTAAIQSPATEILYGGAAGGGKSFFMRALAILLCCLIPGLNVYLFRRISGDLVKNHIEGTSGFPVMLAGLVVSGHVKIKEGEIQFWNGSKIFLCHCEHENDKYKYLGAEIHVLLIDELTMFTEGIYRFLRSRLRAPGLHIPAEARAMFKAKFGVDLAAKIPMVLCGSNPGNIGHVWVKGTWVDLLQPMEVKRVAKSDGGMLRQYIPALLEDNPHIDTDEYEGMLEGIGGALGKAMRRGVWDFVAGAYFECWDPALHVIPPIIVPEHWTRFRSFDWGSARPFSVGWWCLAEGGEYVTLADGSERMFPHGALIRYREWYGVAKGEDGRVMPNVGLKLDNRAIARGIRMRERGEKIFEAGSPADPSCNSRKGGPSILEEFIAATRSEHDDGLRFCLADNERVKGWQMVRTRLLGEDGMPMLYIARNCQDTIRTFPALQHDAARPEDVDSSGEDHCFAAGTLVATPDGPVPIEAMPESGVVWTPEGVRRYRSAGLIKRSAPLIRVEFSDGTSVLCTEDHLFLCSDNEWRYACNLQGRSIACSQLSSAQPSRNSAAPGTTSADGTSSGKVSDCTASFGSTTTELSLTDITFTTWTETRQTTPSKISNAFRWLNTLVGGMAKNLLNAVESRFQQRGPQLRTGTEVLMGGLGTQRTTNETCAPSQRSASVALAADAARNSGQGSSPRTTPSFAETPAKRLRGARLASMTCSGAALHAGPSSSSTNTQSSKRVPHVAARSSVACTAVSQAGSGDVYCLTVPYVGAFLLANGAVVSNCADDIRYMCMARPWSRVERPSRPSGPKPWTMEWIIQQDEEEKRRRADR